MKPIFTIVFCLCFSTVILSQVTLIPDPLFETLLIAEGIDTDGVVNGQVLTSDIADETIIVITLEFKAITDLTGIQDFSSLIYFVIEAANITQLDLSNNLNLHTVDILDVSLENLNINNLANLIVFYFSPDHTNYTSTISSLDLRDNILLSNVVITANSITQLDLSNNPALNSVLLCGMDELVSININNNNNEEINYLRICDNINLECIQVDDPVAVIAATDPPYNSWEFSNINNALITDDCQLAISDFESAQIAVYPNPVRSILYLETKDKSSIEHITMYDSLGKSVINKEGSLKQFDMSSFPSGLYFLQVQTETGLLVEKVIKE